MPSLLDRAKSWLGFGAEGSWRGPFSGMGEQGNWFPLGRYEDGFQRNLSVGHGMLPPMAYACVMLNARAVSQCRAEHLVLSASNAYEPSHRSAAAHILRTPNSYETFAQIMLNTVAEMLFEGEALWFVVRDDRNAIVQVHRVPRRAWTIHVDPESHEIFYGFTNHDLVATPDYLVPARDVCHFRMHTPRHPLVGESPIKAAAMSIGINVALNHSQMMFFAQMSRPSGILSTEAALTREQMGQLRSAFADQSKMWAQGGIPILSNGLKFQPTGIAQSDAQLIEQQKMTLIDISRVFGVPHALLSEGAGPQGGTEALISHWLSVGLGSVLESIERSLERLFALPPHERIELDPSPLLRVDFNGRIDGLAKAVMGGVMTPNEARLREGLGRVTGGDDAFLQRQQTPVSLLSELAAAELTAKNEPPPAQEPPAQDEPKAEPVADSDPDVAKALVISMLTRKRVDAA